VSADPGPTFTHTATGRTRTVVARRAAWSASRSGLVWGLGFGSYVAVSALGYASSYSTPAQREQFARLFGANTAVNALVGPARRLDTVAGFTAWRSLGVLGVIGAIWGLLAATRLLRGEEDAGRWELLLSGHASRRGATTQTLVGIAVGLVALWATASAVIAIAGRSSTARISPSAAGFLAAALVAPAAVFVAIGAVTSQLAATRRQAAGWAGGPLAVAYVLRMVAGSSARLSWLRWLSPLGWVEQLHPLTGSAGSAFLPIVALVAVLVTTSIGLAGRLDLGGSVIRDRVSSEPRTRLLASPFGLAVRLGRSVVLAWTLGIAAMALLMGTLARTAGRSMEGAAGLAQLLARMGARGSGAAAYLGLAFLVVGVMIAFAAAGQVAHAREEEAEGRLDQLLARPVGRTRWLSGRILLIVIVVVVDGCVAGLVAWLGTASQHDGLGLSMLFEAGLNVVAPALLVAGIGVLALGAAPHATSAITYGFLVWSFLLQFIGGLVQANHWLLDTSIFHHMTAAPAVAPDWGTATVIVAAAAVAAGTGAALFHRRDVASS
jgi:ABC-2 type transport system permease protein